MVEVITKSKKNINFAKKLVSILILFLFTTTVSTASTNSAKIPGTFDCELQFVNQKTDSFLIACADGNEFLSKIKWSAWTSTGALGVGKYGINDCKPYCAAGRFHYLDVKVQLSNVKTIKGKQFFTYINWWQIDKIGRAHV